MFLQQVSTKTSADGSNNFLFGEYNYTLTFQLRGSKNYYCNSQPEIQLIPSTPTKSRQKIKQTCREVKNLMNLNSRIRLKAGLGTGQQFPDLGFLKKFDSEQQLPIKPERGQILIFVMYSVQGQDFIKKFHDLYKQKGSEHKVRIISITLNQQKQKIQKIRNDIGQEDREKVRIDYFNITGKETNCSIIYVLGEAIVPYACYVDQNSIVNFVGHPKKLLSVLTNNELKARNIKQKQQQKNLQGDDIIDGKDLEKLQQTFNSNSKFLEIFPQINFVYIKMKIQSKCVRGDVHCRAKVQQLHARKDDTQQLINFIKQIKNINLQNLNIKQSKQQNVPQDQNCYSCQKQAYPLYWIQKQENKYEFHCQQCIPKKKQQIEQNQLKTILLLQKTNKIPQIIPQTNNYECSSCRKKIAEGQFQYYCFVQKVDQKNSQSPKLCKVCIEVVKKKENKQKFNKLLKNLDLTENASYVWLRASKIQPKPKQIIRQQDIMIKRQQGDNQQDQE